MSTKQSKPFPPQSHAQLSRQLQHDKHRRGTHTLQSDASSSIISLAQHSTSHPLPNAKLENTYRLSPEDDQKFPTKTVSDVMQSVLTAYLSDVTYDATRCSQLSRDLSSLIKSRIKEIIYHRYKVVCLVSIGQITGQEVNIASRALWNENTDTQASAIYKGKDFYAVATAYGVYYE